MNPDNPDCQPLGEETSEDQHLGLSHHDHHDYSHHFSSHGQVSEVGSPIVSSTSNQDQEGGMMRETNNSNIGSIITMLIDDQQVNIDDILTEEQYRQDCQEASQPKIKEEVDVQISDYGSSYQDFSFTGENYRGTGTTSTSWSGAGPGHSLHSNHESLISVPSHAQQQTRPVTCLGGPSPGSGPGSGARDDKYWERRRKNNLAAKKSRDTRRMRENQLRLRVLFLENANKVLREQMERKEQESGKLRERLRLYESSEANCHSNNNNQ